MLALKPVFLRLPTFEVTAEKPVVVGYGTLINMLEVTRSKYSTSRFKRLNSVAWIPRLICLCVSHESSGLPAEPIPQPGVEAYRLVPTVAND